MIVEMRTYTTRQGCRDRFLELFMSKTIPAHHAIGMRTLGPFLSVDDPNTFFWMRGFPDAASRAAMKAQFYQGTLWTQQLEHVLIPMLASYSETVVEDTARLIRWA
jgi:NIPSNAP